MRARSVRSVRLGMVSTLPESRIKRCGGSGCQVPQRETAFPTASIDSIGGRRRRRPSVRAHAPADDRGARPRSCEVPRRAHRLPRVLPRRDDHGLRVPQGGARGARALGTRQVPDARARRPPVPLGAGPARRDRRGRDARARARCLADGGPQAGRRRAREWIIGDVKRRLRDRLRRVAGATSKSGANLEQLSRTWDTLGEQDALWAILTQPGTRGGGWDVERFFGSGREQVDGALRLVEEEVGWSIPSGRALDFGCGVGRLAQALCARFDQVDGVDIAASMIRGAERFNRFGERCRYHLNQRDDLSLFEDRSFDFIYSTYVFQHMRPSFARGYVREF